MTLAVPITIYVGAFISLLLTFTFGAACEIKKSSRSRYENLSWSEIILGTLAVISAVGAWIGFPAGTITLIIWAVLTLAGS